MRDFRLIAAQSFHACFFCFVFSVRFTLCSVTQHITQRTSFRNHFSEGKKFILKTSHRFAEHGKVLEKEQGSDGISSLGMQDRTKKQEQHSIYQKTTKVEVYKI